MTIKCQHCQDTGEIDQMGSLDCTHCEVAIHRNNLNMFVEELGPVTPNDLVWAVHQRAIEQERAKWIGTGWLPMEAAPKDGREVQLLSEYGVDIAQWCDYTNDKYPQFDGEWNATFGHGNPIGWKPWGWSL